MDLFKSKLKILMNFFKAKYLQDLIKKWDDHIASQENDLLDFEKDLRILYQPFPILLIDY